MSISDDIFTFLTVLFIGGLCAVILVNLAFQFLPLLLLLAFIPDIMGCELTQFV